jgi:hypothetical protein
MSDALYKSQQEFKQAKVEAEVLLVKEQKAMADTSPEGLAEASEYAAKEQKVVQKMEQESMEQTQLVSACRNQPTTWPLCNSSFCFVPFLQGSAKKRDLKVERWLRIHRERGAVPFDQPPGAVVSQQMESESPQIERREAPQAAPVLEPRYPVSSMPQAASQFFEHRGS